MGTKCAPTYANLSLGYLEQTLYRNVQDKFSKEKAEKLSVGYKRYVDDVIIFVNSNRIGKEVITNMLNSLDDRLLFRCESSRTEVIFLDIKLTMKII